MNREPGPGRSLHSRLRRLFLPAAAATLPVDGSSHEIARGAARLHLLPDLPLAADLGRAAPDFLVFEPGQAAAGIHHFLRLRPGKRLALSASAPEHLLACGAASGLLDCGLSIRHARSALVIRTARPEAGIAVRRLAEEDGAARALAERRRALRCVAAAFGGPLSPLAPRAALSALREVNALLARESFRAKDSRGVPGSLLDLPPDVTPILVGDLHARADNLLSILGSNAFCRGLEQGAAAMILLGDAVHPEAGDALARMDSSVLMMDLVFALKLRFPERFFYVVGNHDSFSPEIAKAGVRQSLLWSEHVRALRGDEYHQELARFYALCPLMACSKDFIACHGGAPRAAITRELLVGARQDESLVREITTKRLRGRFVPGGYMRADVRRLRRALGLANDTAFVVGHHPRADFETVWMDVAGTPHHHVVYSARAERAAVFTRVAGSFVPQVYRVEPLAEWLTRGEGAAAGGTTAR